MPPELTINIDVALKVDATTEDALKKLLRTSQHETPILALMKSGSGPSEEPVEMKWTVMTHDRQALSMIPYLAFRVNELPIFATHYDLEGLKAKVSSFKLHLVDGRLIVELPGDVPEIW